jgi:hypothetical protein
MSGIDDTLVVVSAEQHSATAVRAFADGSALDPRASRLSAASAARDVWELLIDPPERR